jgi:restriction system protein
VSEGTRTPDRLDHNQDAARRSTRRITLIDGDSFLDLWVEHYGRVDEEGRQLLPIKPVYFLDLET